MNGPAPTPPRGLPDAARLTAAQKLSDATSLPEALGWLDTQESIRVAAEPELLTRLAELAQQR